MDARAQQQQQEASSSSSKRIDEDEQPHSQIDTGALVSELNSYLAAYTSASSAPLLLPDHTVSSRTEAGEDHSTQQRADGEQDGSGPPLPGTSMGTREDQQQADEHHDYAEALASLLSTLETRRASVRTQISRLIRSMSDDLELPTPSLANTGLSRHDAFAKPSLTRSTSSQMHLAGTRASSTALMAAVEDIQRGAERCLASLDELAVT